MTRPPPQEQPGSSRTPPEEGVDAGHDAEEQSVGQRIGDVRHHRGGGADGSGGYRGKDKGRSHGCDAQAADRPVEPHAGLEPPETGPDEQDDAGIGAGVEAEVQEVCGRGEGHGVELGEDDRVVEVAGRPHRHAEAEQQPCRPFPADGHGSGQANPGCEKEDPVVQPPIEWGHVPAFAEHSPHEGRDDVAGESGDEHHLCHSDGDASHRLRPGLNSIVGGLDRRQIGVNRTAPLVQPAPLSRAHVHLCLLNSSSTYASPSPSPGTKTSV